MPGLDRDHTLHETHLYSVVLAIADDDIVTAENLFQDHLSDGAYLPTKLCEAEEELIKAYKSNDGGFVLVFWSKDIQ